MKQQVRTLRTLARFGAAISLAIIAAPSPAAAQGCEPIRFTAPVNLGGQGEAYQPGHEWQLTLAYRRLTSNEFFVGTRQNPALGPGGQAPVFKIHTVVADIAYAINDRYRVRLSVPMSTGSVTRMYADKALHEQTARGLGDVSVMGESWLLHAAHARERQHLARFGAQGTDRKPHGRQSVLHGDRIDRLPR